MNEEKNPIKRALAILNRRSEKPAKGITVAEVLAVFPGAKVVMNVFDAKDPALDKFSARYQTWFIRNGRWMVKVRPRWLQVVETRIDTNQELSGVSECWKAKLPRRQTPNRIEVDGVCEWDLDTQIEWAPGEYEIVRSLPLASRETVIWAKRLRKPVDGRCFRVVEGGAFVKICGATCGNVG
jgi:hypothetical protein